MVLQHTTSQPNRMNTLFSSDWYASMHFAYAVQLATTTSTRTLQYIENYAKRQNLSVVFIKKRTARKVKRKTEIIGGAKGGGRGCGGRGCVRRLI